MTCPNCRHENVPASRFCSQCGTKLPAVCTHCGAQFSPNDRFCSQCGAALAGVTAATAPAEQIATTSARAYAVPANTGPASAFSNFTIRILNYTATKRQMFTSQGFEQATALTGGQGLFLMGGAWAPSVLAPITTITFLTPAGNFVAGSRFTVYAEA